MDDSAAKPTADASHLIECATSLKVGASRDAL
jgi:hypothetical protein